MQTCSRMYLRYWFRIWLLRYIDIVILYSKRIFILMLYAYFYLMISLWMRCFDINDAYFIVIRSFVCSILSTDNIKRIQSTEQAKTTAIYIFLIWCRHCPGGKRCIKDIIGLCENNLDSADQIVWTYIIEMVPVKCFCFSWHTLICIYITTKLKWCNNDWRFIFKNQL